MPKQKGDQDGSRAFPRHIYANPRDPILCPILALSLHIFSNIGRRDTGSRMLFDSNGEADDGEADDGDYGDDGRSDDEEVGRRDSGGGGSRGGRASGGGGGRGRGRGGGRGTSDLRYHKIVLLRLYLLLGRVLN